jgi:hypothetical protein
MQSKLASDELQILNPLFALSGSYQCRASNTTIQNLGRPNPVEWVRCGSVLIYDARIAETRHREASLLKLAPGAKIVPFIQAMERAYHFVGIHKNWSREETRRHIIDRFTVETFGTKFMKLFIEAYPTPPLPEAYGAMKDKCKLIASRLELKADVNPDEAGLHTLVIKEKKSAGPHKPSPKESGKSPNEPSSSVTDIHATINKAVQSAMKAFTKQQTLLISKGNEKKQPVASDAPKCPHCKKPHLKFRSAAICWLNPAVPLEKIPEHARAALANKRKGKGKATDNGAESSSRITEMTE